MAQIDHSSKKTLSHILVAAIATLSSYKLLYHYVGPFDTLSWLTLLMLGALIWYALETLEIRRLTHQSLVLNYVPILTLRWKFTNKHTHGHTQEKPLVEALSVSNLGSGPAINVRVFIDSRDPTVQFPTQEYKVIQTIPNGLQEATRRAKVQAIPLLGAQGEDALLPITSFSYFRRPTFRILVRCEDIFGRELSQVFVPDDTFEGGFRMHDWSH